MKHTRGKGKKKKRQRKDKENKKKQGIVLFYRENAGPITYHPLCCFLYAMMSSPCMHEKENDTR